MTLHAPSVNSPRPTSWLPSFHSLPTEGSTSGSIRQTRPSINEDYWVPLVQEADALLVGGGESLYLCYWMWQSGLADLLPSLRQETVYVGVSAGSIVVNSTLGEHYDGINPPTGSDKALGLVDFALRLHLDNPSLPEYSLANLEQWAARVDVPAYVLDDRTAIKVSDGEVSVVSEGHWKRFTH